MSQDQNTENTSAKSPSAAQLLSKLEKSQLRTNIPAFRVGDSVKVHAKIREGGKERVQIFEGVVIRRNKGNHSTATFTVRKISYNIGVERTFLLHSPRIEKIELISRGQVRRSRLYYLRDIRGKASRIKSELVVPVTGEAPAAVEAVAAEAK